MRLAPAFLPLVALLLSPVPSQAVDGASQSATHGPALSQELLRRCVTMNIENDEHKEGMKVAEQQMEAVQRAARDLGRDIDRQRRALDRTDGAAVDAFNELIDRHDLLRAELDEKVDAFNALVDAFNPAAERFNQQCAGVGHTWDVRHAEKERQLKLRAAGKGGDAE